MCKRFLLALKQRRIVNVYFILMEILVEAYTSL